MPRPLPPSLTAAPPAVPPHLRHHAATSPQQLAAAHPGRFAHLCVGALIFRRRAPAGGPAQSQLLLLQRAATDHAPGVWEVPGGGVEPAEDATVLHAVVREVFEETGLRVGRFVRQVWDRRGGRRGGWAW
ncbi:uncharacterized protein L3040_005809 [Drepanopeziza brunnea f. sp. 'multigermtubi']|uniref:uncharacterized protein n=1 Tax=Drepanopeziza brunnea f. sp. 'multigermtubi' TaxID=698441 RepID=UPI00238C343E|nr:hypothetical protein L3040_005809 [Drepanopeziza brunnea f. sp. 'multigermtubi']